MKRVIISILLSILCFTLAACGSSDDIETSEPSPSEFEIVQDTAENDESASQETDVAEPETNNSKITMPYSSEDYCGIEWKLDTLTEHLAELGFTNIQTVACKPGDDRYRFDIFDITIETGLFSTGPWEAGEEYKSNAEITIYYNEFPMLTVDNCPDLVTVLTSKEMDYMSFANAYDGRYVEFDAYVTYHHTYDGGTSHIIEVTGGDYDGVREIDPFDSSCFDGLIIRIGDRTWEHWIDESVVAGDNVRVSGRIDASFCEYFKALYVETRALYCR